MAINKEKYLNAILYFIENCNNKYLGTTKLNKLLYYLDFISFRDREKTVTGDVYIHQSFGPVPAEIESKILPKMKEDGLIEIKNIPYKEKYTNEFVLKQKPKMSSFDAYEKKLLKNLCLEFKNTKTEDIVAQTHLEAPWYYSEMYDKIDLRNAFDIEVLSR